MIDIGPYYLPLNGIIPHGFRYVNLVSSRKIGVEYYPYSKWLWVQRETERWERLGLLHGPNGLPWSLYRLDIGEERGSLYVTHSFGPYCTLLLCLLSPIPQQARHDLGSVHYPPTRT